MQNQLNDLEITAALLDGKDSKVNICVDRILHYYNEGAGLELHRHNDYEVIKSQAVEQTSSMVFIGYSENSLPPNEPPYCCWVEKNGMRTAVTTAFTESEALITFYDQISTLERSVPQLTKVQPQKRIPIREQLAAARLRRSQSVVKSPTVSKKDKGIER